MGAMSTTHWLIVIAVALVLFGAKRLPDVARSLAQSARIFRAEIGEVSKPDDPAGSATRTPAPLASAPQPKSVPQQPDTPQTDTPPGAGSAAS